MQLKKQNCQYKNPRWTNGKKSHFFIWNLPKQKSDLLGASYHFAENINQIEYTDETEDYFKQHMRLMKKHWIYWLQNRWWFKSTEGAIQWASYKKYYEQIYSIVFHPMRAMVL
jgi:hypothetical protein